MSHLQQQYRLTEFGRCRGLARNSAARGKLWALIIIIIIAVILKLKPFKQNAYWLQTIEDLCVLCGAACHQITLPTCYY